MSAERAICRLLAGAKLVGLGFAVDREHVVTCAHVVNKAHEASASALGRALEQADFPASDLRLTAVFAIARDAHHARSGTNAGDTPASGTAGDSAEQRLREAELTGRPLEEGWLPSTSRSFTGADVAVLRLSERLPDYVPLVVPSQALSGDAAQVYGPVPGRPDGGHVPVEVLGEVERGRVQINSGGMGFRVRPGFSGGPVWRRGTNEVVGMLTACGTGDDAVDAYMLSAGQIARAWPAWRVAPSQDDRPGRDLPADPPRTGDLDVSDLIRSRLLSVHRMRALYVIDPESKPTYSEQRLAACHGLGPGEKIIAIWRLGSPMPWGSRHGVAFTSTRLSIEDGRRTLSIPYSRFGEFEFSHDHTTTVHTANSASDSYSISIDGAGLHWGYGFGVLRAGEPRQISEVLNQLKQLLTENDAREADGSGDRDPDG